MKTVLVIMFITVLVGIYFLSISQKMKARAVSKVIYLVFFLVFFGFSIKPTAADKVANQMGLSKGTDLLFYVTSAMLFNLTIIFYVQVKRLNLRIIELSRAVSFLAHEKKNK